MMIRSLIAKLLLLTVMLGACVQQQSDSESDGVLDRINILRSIKHTGQAIKHYRKFESSLKQFENLRKILKLRGKRSAAQTIGLIKKLNNLSKKSPAFSKYYLERVTKLERMGIPKLKKIATLDHRAASEIKSLKELNKSKLIFRRIIWIFNFFVLPTAIFNLANKALSFIFADRHDGIKPYLLTNLGILQSFESDPNDIAFLETIRMKISENDPEAIPLGLFILGATCTYEKDHVLYPLMCKAMGVIEGCDTDKLGIIACADSLGESNIKNEINVAVAEKVFSNLIRCKVDREFAQWLVLMVRDVNDQHIEKLEESCEQIAKTDEADDVGNLSLFHTLQDDTNDILSKLEEENAFESMEFYDFRGWPGQKILPRMIMQDDSLTELTIEQEF